MTYRVAVDSLDWALKHIRAYGDTDIYPVPFEFSAIEQSWQSVRGYLASQDLDTWVVRPQRTFLIPKGRFAYRIASQPDPLDSLLYVALIYELGAQLESARIPVSEGCVQSNRFLGGEAGEMYDPEFSWSEFIARCEERVEDTAATHVLVADISDFFHRLYHHRIENTLQSACADEDGARVLYKMIHQWAGTTSYGLPVGPAASRLVAEVSLHDIDQILQGSGARFVRFVDDYRVFCTSHREAYEKLTLLAESLFESHGLTLQPQKTHIVSRAAFQEKYLKSHRSKELEGLSEQFDEIASELGVGWYEPIDPTSLTESQMSAIEALNLHGLVHEQLDADEIDIGLVKFLIWRLVQIDDASLAGDLVRHAESLYPVFPQFIAYLGAVGPSQISDSAGTAGELLGLLSGSSVGQLPFHRALVLWLFGADTKWASALADGDRARLVASFEQATSSLERRESILAMGRLNQQPWFRTRKRTWANFDPWQRRAFLAAASCLPKDERQKWYASIAKQVDPVEKAVVAWAKANPFGT